MKDRIQNFIKPYVKENKILKKDYDKLFGNFDNEMLDLVHNTLEELQIDIVSDISFKNSLCNLNTLKNIDMNNEQLCLLFQQGENIALDALIIKNKRLIYSRVLRHSKTYHHDLSVDDLFQEGCIGMIKAAERYDIERAKFSTYSIYWIDQAIIRAIADTGYTIRVPVHMYEKVNKYKRIIREMEALDLSSDNVDKEVMDRMDIDYNQLMEIANIAEYILNTTSLNIFIGESKDTELIELLEVIDVFDPEDTAIEISMKNDIYEALGNLTKRESDVIKLRFGLNTGIDRTLEEVGQVFGLTRERIRQIEAKGLRKLKLTKKTDKLKEYLYD